MVLSKLISIQCTVCAESALYDVMIRELGAVFTDM